MIWWVWLLHQRCKRSIFTTQLITEGEVLEELDGLFASYYNEALSDEERAVAFGNALEILQANDADGLISERV